ncbi:hypothetical protein jhhlp_000240 [Lomentospora prolificans]|uniref:C2H2-type domain-containing protein n=1 Tax=Lomentospora prolificans TaxID=41688 RepID=A0A2N3NKE0_9PEZI|nr:hypothetical protein jhhlp_000240 [Lomentospora prolificans]
MSLYDPDEGTPTHTPPLKAVLPNFALDPEPECEGIIQDHPRGPEAFLVSTLDNKRNPDVPRQIIENEDDPEPFDKESPATGVSNWTESNPPTPNNNMRAPSPRGRGSDTLAVELQQLAHNALANVAPSSQSSDPSVGPQPSYEEPRRQHSLIPAANRELPFRGDGSLPPVSTTNSTPAPATTPGSSTSYGPLDTFHTGELFSALNPVSPVGTGPAGPLVSPKSIDPRSPTTSLPPPRPPQQSLPPLNSGPNSTGRLPSLHQLMAPGSPTGPLERDDDHPPYGSPFSFQPPTALPRPPPIPGQQHQGTPPVSPNGSSYARELPSPLKPQGPPQFYYATSKPGPSIINPISHSTSPLPRSAGGEYGPSGIPERTPSTDHSSLSAGEGPIPGGNGAAGGSDVGTFRCTFEGCHAKPFQTQYLLNSHANVHSSARPHYCPVQGCPRSKPGQGFKRKNEMIRHGFVHESPGYACPFCPDREHKYPRPDNLQRHVRSRHLDKDKNDPKLLEVLSQRRDGLSRGRRRRGGPS